MSFEIRNAKRAQTHTSTTPRWEVYRDTERGPCLASDYMRRDGDSLTFRALRAFCEVNNQQLEWADEYGEPGYTNPTQGILFCDWNEIPKALSKRLEAQGWELEWLDEWYIDYDHGGGKAYRTTADSHGWESRVRYCDGYVLTPDDDADDWIADSLNDDARPLPSWFDSDELESRGFSLIYGETELEVGFHPGQNETPNKFTPKLRAMGLDVVLQVTGRGQFDVSYRIWTRAPEVTCDQCQMLAINGVACHERGCPNMGARWDQPTQTWIKQRECFDCGCTVDADQPCCTND